MSADAIIIMGKGRGRRDPLPLRVGPGVELWTLNDDRHPEATAHFEVHWPRRHDTSDLLVPVYVWSGAPEVRPNELRYPVEVVGARFDLRPGHRMLGCTVACMLALACLWRPGRILLPGVTYPEGLPEKYREQKKSVEFWLGVARCGLGIRVDEQEGSTLLAGEDYR